MAASIKAFHVAALIVTVLYIVIGFNLNITPEIESIDPLKLIPYLSVIILAICGVNVLVVLTIGLFLCAVIGLTHSSAASVSVSQAWET